MVKLLCLKWSKKKREGSKLLLRKKDITISCPPASPNFIFSEEESTFCAVAVRKGNLTILLHKRNVGMRGKAGYAHFKISLGFPDVTSYNRAHYHFPGADDDYDNPARVR